MRNLFLLFFCIILALTMKTVKRSSKTAPNGEVIEALYIEKSHVIDFNGTIFVPRTIRLLRSSVKPKAVELTVAGKKFMYYPNFGQYYLKGEAREVRVEKGEEIKVSETGTAVRFFFAREV